jgi:glycosyltransferase involved in cell wall biosynthesis
MDVFAFSSLSETQGLVLVEAMACGVPVVALDASGARDIVRDHENGRLLPEADEEAFSAALEEVTRAGAEGRRRLRAAALRTAKDFSLERSADEALSIYRRLVAARRPEPMPWEAAVLWASTQWSVLENVAASAKEALAGVGEPS